MTQKIIQVGTSLAVVIPKPFQEELGFRAGGNVDLKIEKEAVIIKPVSKLSKEDQKIARLAFNFMQRYHKDLKSLANK